jgi:thymidylate synthase (FAD)
MNIVQPSYEIVECPEDPLKRIEKAARTCYKTEDRIDEGSAERLVRHLVSRRHFAMLEFGGVLWVRFISNRGFSHEQVRHRLASYAQESTRYCNYGQDKFGSEVSFIDPQTIVPKRWTGEQIETWLLGCDECFRFAEEWYLKMIDMGIPAQYAREILPIGLKTEINVQANFVEWRHIFEQRTSLAAHPRMRELMIPLLRDVADRVPIIFDDLLGGLS